MVPSQAPRASRSRQNPLTTPDPPGSSQSPRIRTPRRAGTNSARGPAPTGNFPLKAPCANGANGSFRSGKVAANLNSYDRRDPFSAFHALIKLLASLPSRLVAGAGGGCQYKLLTIDEHKLCMHLCNVVEPYMLSALSASPLLVANNMSSPNALFRPRMVLFHQPTEILDRITSFIEDREDLMNFGISCKRLAEVVFPRHWEYRVIRAKVSMSGVWKHLYERADLAANVRVIEVMDERSGRKVVLPRVCRKVGGALEGKQSTITNEEVVSATSTEEDSSASANENENGSEAMLSKLSVHKRQEKYFVAALANMTGLVTLKWEGNHSPISVVDDGSVWKTIAERCISLQTLGVADNVAFAPSQTIDTSDEEGKKENQSSRAALFNLRSASFRSTQFNYGAIREPEMNRIATILHQCPNLESLEIVYKAPKAGSPAAFSIPLANEFLTYGRWSHLISLTLDNLSCLNAIITTTVTSSSAGSAMSTTHTIQQNPLQTFLSAHPSLEILKLLNMGPSSLFRRLRTPLEPNTLPRLRELHASRELVTMILKSECHSPRPLEIIKGFKLVGAAGTGGKYAELGGFGNHGLGSSSNGALEFYKSLKTVGGSVKRIEAEAWGDLDDVRMLAWCVPGLTWLDVGRKLRHSSPNSISSGASNAMGSRGSLGQGPVTNMVEWAEVLSSFEELATFHGVKFFYEISSSALPGVGISNDTSTGSSAGATVTCSGTSSANISMTDRSRIKKNDEIAGVLAWKCKKLRRVDHWEGGLAAAGKVIVLLRDSDIRSGVDGKVRWDVRRIKH